MKHILFILSFFVLFSFQNITFAQSDYLKFKTFRPYEWMFGLGWSFIDNDGRSHSHFFDFKESWHYLPFPSYVFADKYLNNGFSLELAASFNTFDGVKMVNEAYPTGHTFSSDFTLRYSFYKLFQPTKWFDPYFGVGVGLSNVTTASSYFFPTANGVIGMNFWIKDFGIRIQGTGKLGLVNDIYYNDSNYLHYTASLLYRIHASDGKDNFNKPKHKWTKKKPKQYKGRSK